LITLEGPEGSGKSSQARWLVAWLRRQGLPVVAARDPGSTALGRRLRGALLHDEQLALTPLTEALLFIAGRIQLVDELIKPALAQGKVVVCDRFHDSTVAYQGFGGGLDVKWLDAIGRRAIGGLMPDLTIVLDVPTSVGFARLHRSRDRMERKALAFHRRVREGFRRMAAREPRRIVVVDASQPAARVRHQIQTIARARLKQH
jgi:dTMP kinase